MCYHILAAHPDRLLNVLNNASVLFHLHSVVAE